MIHLNIEKGQAVRTGCDATEANAFALRFM